MIMTGISKLIEHQSAMQEIRERLDHPVTRLGRCVEHGVAYGPCLLISRECAAGGGKIARLAGERLGWPVYDQEIVNEIARVAHERQHLMESVDERAISVWQHTWEDILTGTGATDTQYLRALREVIMTLGHHGNAVIVGRGAQLFLPQACALRVRLVAPLAWRARHVMELESLTERQARDKIERLDAARALFVWKTFKLRVDSPVNYDLVINTEHLSPESAAQIVLAALANKLGVLCPTVQAVPR